MVTDFKQDLVVYLTDIGHMFSSFVLSKTVIKVALLIKTARRDLFFLGLNSEDWLPSKCLNCNLGKPLFPFVW